MTIENIPDGSITTPRGFEAGATEAGLKYQGRLDMALLRSVTPCAAAGVFTKSQVVAAPVILCREALAAARAEIVGVAANAGIANACTGEPGLIAGRAMQEEAATALGCRAEQVLVLSTGVIGMQLPEAKTAAGIWAAAGKLRADGGHDAARAIMTTDTVPKEAAVRVMLPEGEVLIGGMAKGSGMIHPDMATMLAVITTDAGVAPEMLQEVLQTAADGSFNRISVDGDTSTNDTVLLLANGASGVRIGEASRAAFSDGVTAVCRALAQMIVRDGEGATKFVTVTVQGAADHAGAHRVANTIAISPLVKTALAGGDANWGRIMMAAGRAGVPFAQERTALWIGTPGGDRLQLVAGGTPTDYAEEEATRIFAGREIEILLELGAGAATETVWTCDLTHEYVSINADYRS